jgi:hypothetical protein
MNMSESNKEVVAQALEALRKVCENSPKTVDTVQRIEHVGPDICAGMRLIDYVDIARKVVAQRDSTGWRSHLTPRERALPVTVVFCSRENLDAGIARTLALTAQGEYVELILEGS